MAKWRLSVIAVTFVAILMEWIAKIWCNTCIWHRISKHNRACERSCRSNFVSKWIVIYQAMRKLWGRWAESPGAYASCNKLENPKTPVVVGPCYTTQLQDFIDILITVGGWKRLSRLVNHHGPGHLTPDHFNKLPVTSSGTYSRTARPFSFPGWFV